MQMRSIVARYDSNYDSSVNPAVCTEVRFQQPPHNLPPPPPPPPFLVEQPNKDTSLF
jgi:hypothetical protein